MKQISCAHAQQVLSWAHPHQARESTKTRTGRFLSAQTTLPMSIGSRGREPLVTVTEWETAERRETSLHTGNNAGGFHRGSGSEQRLVLGVVYQVGETYSDAGNQSE